MKRYTITYINIDVYISTDALSPVNSASEMFSTMFEPRFLRRNKHSIYTLDEVTHASIYTYSSVSKLVLTKRLSGISLKLLF